MTDRHAGDGRGRSAPGGRDARRDADPVAATILELLEMCPLGKSIAPGDAARIYANDRAAPGEPPRTWRRYLPQVRQQALRLAREGRIVILRKGRPVDPSAPVKGVIRLRLPDDGVVG